MTMDTVELVIIMFCDTEQWAVSNWASIKRNHIRQLANGQASVSRFHIHIRTVLFAAKTIRYYDYLYWIGHVHRTHYMLAFADHILPTESAINVSHFELKNTHSMMLESIRVVAAGYALSQCMHVIGTAGALRQHDKYPIIVFGQSSTRCHFTCSIAINTALFDKLTPTHNLWPMAHGHAQPMRPLICPGWFCAAGAPCSVSIEYNTVDNDADWE